MLERKDLDAQLELFADWKLAAFSAAIAERMFPNYLFFARLTEFGDTAKLRDALNQVWDRLSNRPGKSNFETLLAKVDAEVPSVDDFDFYGVYPALDAAVALCGTLDQMQSASVDEALHLAELSSECVATFLEFTADPDVSDEELVRFIATHELTEQELQFQQTLVAMLADQEQPTATLLDAVRELAANGGVSNIGIADEG